MAAIFQEVELTWKGETYTVTPTYGLIQQIEQKVSIAGMATRIQAGEPPLSHVAFVVASLLRAAGCRDATPGDVFAALMSPDTEPDALADLCVLVVNAFVPQSAGGNADAPALGGKKTSGRKKK